MSRAPAKPPESDPKSPVETEPAAISKIDTTYLECLIGYNARRAALTIIGSFLERMAVYGVRPVEFSVLSVIRHNPGITSRQLCACLGLLPPNLVTMLNQLGQRDLVARQPHPHDGRAISLSLTPHGLALMNQAEATAYQLELDATASLTDAQRATLKKLLRMVYAPEPAAPRTRTSRARSKLKPPASAG